MSDECKIDMYHGERYDSKRHNVPICYWSDTRLIYWGWIYTKDKERRLVGDFTAPTVQAAERALHLKFREP